MESNVRFSLLYLLLETGDSDGVCFINKGTHSFFFLPIWSEVIVVKDDDGHLAYATRSTYSLFRERLR